MTDSAIQLEKTKKYDLPLSCLDYTFISECENIKELEKIIKVLRSGEEGFYPDLEKAAVEKLEKLNPKSRILRKETPVLQPGDLQKDEKNKMEEDMQDFLSVMKSKDSGSGDTTLTGNKTLPPVRKGQINLSTKKQETKPEVKSNKSSLPRSYSDWDKIDVDKELDNMDKEEERKQQEQEENKNIRTNKKVVDISTKVDSEGLSYDEICIRAGREKDKGNEAFKCSDFEEAVLYYTRSLSLVQTANLYNNRALAYLKLEKWKEALEDCDEVLDEEPDNIKALLRRSTAYLGLKDVESADRDLNDIANLDKNNKRAKDLLKESADLRKQAENQKKERKVKGRRMVIEETEGSDDEVNHVNGTTPESNAVDAKTKIEEIPVHKQNGLHEDPAKKNTGTAQKVVEAKVETNKKKPEKDIWSLDEIENCVNINSDIDLNAMGMGIVNTETLPEKPPGFTNNSRDSEGEEEIEVEKPSGLTITEITDEDENADTTSTKVESVKQEDIQKQEKEDWAKTGARPKTMSPRQQSVSSDSDDEKDDWVSPETQAEVKVETKPAETFPQAEGAYSRRTVFKQEKLPPNMVAVKEEGSALFRTGQYPKAILRYTHLIDELEKDVIHQLVNLSLMYSNRAACYLKTGHCKAAITDCQRSLDIIPHMVKPLLRRAAACEHLEKYSQAYVDYKHILSIDSSVVLALSGASRCQNILQQLDGPTWREKLPPMVTALSWEIPEIILDGTTSSPSVLPSESSPPPEELPNPDLEFEECKKLGNSHVQKSEFIKAVECYNICIKQCPDNPVGYTNRAHCYLKLNQPAEAARDCDRAIELDSTNCKALYRRALANKMLKHYKDCLQDLSQVLKLDPKNTAAQKEFDAVRKIYKEELNFIKENTPPAEQTNAKKKPRTIEEITADVKKVLEEAVPDTKPESKSTQKSSKANRSEGAKSSSGRDSRKSSEEPTDTGRTFKNKKNKGKNDEPLQTTVNKSSAKSPVVSKEDEMQKIQEDLDWLEPKQPEAPLSKSAKRRAKAKAKKTGETVVEEEEAEVTKTDGKATKKERTSSESQKSDSKSLKKDSKNGSETESKSSKKSKADSKKSSESEASPKTETDAQSPTDSAAQSKSTKKKKQKQGSKESSPVMGQMQTSSIDPKKIKATPYEFMTAWNSLKSSKQSEPYTDLLRQVPPQELPKVLTNKLEGPMLTTMLKCIHKDIVSKGENDLGYKMLHHLSTVPRFSTVSMFLSTEDIKDISSAFAKLEKSASTEFSSSDIEALKKAYNIK
ncbi:sperm-associated antigen 1 [Patella vulgata]|uniref:sperm-associated antigen 1 n=1 Tax=Patella vulgata TaxID=6465 RepID=UPI0024A7A4E1|nr:sperm-associated antigen 1 [Patella vulgata]